MVFGWWIRSDNLYEERGRYFISISTDPFDAINITIRMRVSSVLTLTAHARTPAPALQCVCAFDMILYASFVNVSDQIDA